MATAASNVYCLPQGFKHTARVYEWSLIHQKDDSSCGCTDEVIDRHVIAGDEGVSTGVKPEQTDSTAGQSPGKESAKIPTAAAAANANVQRMLRSMVKPQDGSDCAVSM